MASLSIPYSDFVAGTTIVSDQVDQNNAAIVNYINARNAASASWDAVSTVGAFTSTLTSNQIILGTTRTVTLTAPTPASTSRVVTFPDLSADYSVIGTAGTQTITGAKTFTSSTLLLQEAGSTDVVTVAVATLAAGRTYTVPDAGAAASFVMTEGAQTINGAITLTAQMLGGAGSNTAPTFAVGATNVGMYRSAANTIAFATNGTIRLTVDNNGDCNCFSTFRVTGTGTATFPDYARIDDTNTGLRLTGSDALSLTTGGTDYLTISSAGLVALGSGSGAVNVRINTSTTTGASTGTLTNAPAAGNPTGYLQVSVNGTTGKIPYWT